MTKQHWIHAEGRTTFLEKEKAAAAIEKGRDILLSTLVQNDGIWDTPTAIELSRAKTPSSDIADIVGDDFLVLRIKSNVPQLHTNIQSALKAAGVLDRQQGIYNGTVLEPPGPCIVIANEQGREKLELFLRKTLSNVR